MGGEQERKIERNFTPGLRVFLQRMIKECYD